MIPGVGEVARTTGSAARVHDQEGPLNKLRLTIGSAGRTRDAFERGHLLPPGIGIAGKAIAEGRPVIGDPLGPGALMTEDFPLPDAPTMPSSPA